MGHRVIQVCGELVLVGGHRRGHGVGADGAHKRETDVWPEHG